MGKKLTVKEFIDKSNIIHQNKYDYSLVEYKNIHTKVKIICKIHGVFEQTPNNHIYKNGCPICNHSHKLNTSEFIKKSNIIHKNRYDYSLSKYKNNREKIKIICQKHGIFEQKPNNHLNGQGCPKCSIENHQLTNNEFIEKSNIIHDYKYDYSLTEYVNCESKINILCRTHGLFQQTPKNHLSGQGCPICKESVGEKNIRKILENNNIIFIVQKRFKNCRYVRTLPFDFYLPNHDICIEFDGEQHYNSIEWFGGNERLYEQQVKDKIKNDFCKENNIKLIRFKYDENINLMNLINN